MGINIAIVTTLGTNGGVGFMVSVDRFKPVVEEILLTDHILMRGKGINLEGSNGRRPSAGNMGMELVDKRVRLYQSHRDLS